MRKDDPIRICIVAPGNPIPPFILRRLVKLDDLGLPLLIFVKHPESVQGVFKHAVLLNAGLRMRSFQTALLHPITLARLWIALRNLPWKARLKSTLIFLPLARKLKQIDVVHIQWIGSAKDYAWIRRFFSGPMVASARGSQVTIYPAVREGYETHIRECFQAVDWIHCVSEDIRKKCVELGAAEDKTFVNYNGVDTEFFQPALRLAPSPSGFRLINVGALSQRKGQSFLLLLLRRLKDINIPASLTLIGSGAERESLQYMASRLQVTDAVRWIESFDQHIIRDALRDADLYVSCSMAEGLQNSAAEAAACGLPVLAFACEGMQELVGHHKTGFVVPYGDLEQMAAIAVDLYAGRSDRSAIARLARQNAEQHFGADAHALKMAAFYQHIAANAG